MKLNIVLAQPQIPQNTGNIARTCAVTGAALHIIKPMGFTPTDRQLKRAGLDYWHYLDISYYESFDDFFTYQSGQNGKCFFFSTKAQNRYTDVSYPDGCFIVFGREDAGLPEELLFKNRESCVRIPMMPTLRSLNLSNSVAIAAYEILRQWDFPELQNEGTLTKFDWSKVDQI
ncbi:MAG: tRNA (cytidine(34)-2'-O)-methyltransferase [Oscillospiraceae bacterium]|nr:tRNA (cytidine(34)-2'-O)-methyltransferase [Oscillospiraceae bacterium]